MQVLSRLTAVSLAIVSFSSHALGLGEIELRSYLNQPLRAEVPLRDVASGDIGNVRVRVGTAEQYQRAGLLRDDYIGTVNVEVVDTPAGPVVRVHGNTPLREPFIDLLVEVRLGRNQLQRQYTLLLDPPVSAPREDVAARPEPETPAEPPRQPATPPAPEPAPAPAQEPLARTPAAPERGEAIAAVPVPPARAAVPRTPPAPPPATPAPQPPTAAAAPAPEVARPQPERLPRRDAGDGFFTAPGERRLDPELVRAIQRPAAREAAPAAAAPARQAEDGVYTVAAGETLWRVAESTRPDARVTMNQMMVAIATQNPDAFLDGNALALRRGARLQIPDRERIVAVDEATASARMAALSEGRMRTTELAAAPREVAERRPAEAASAETRPEAPAAAAGATLATELLAEAETLPETVAEAEVVDRAEGDELAAEDEDSDTVLGALPDGPAVVGGDATTPETPAADASPTVIPVATVPAAATSGLAIDWRMVLLGVGAFLLAVAALLAIRRRRAEARETAEDTDVTAPDFSTGPRTGTVAIGAEEGASDELLEQSFDDVDAEAYGADEGDATESLSEPDDWDREFAAEDVDADAERGDRGSAAAGVAAAAGLAGAAAVTADEDEAPAAPASREELLSDADFRISFGMLDDAETRLKEALAESPDDAAIHCKLAEVYAAGEREGDFRKAAANARDAGADGAQLALLAQLEDGFGKGEASDADTDTSTDTDAVEGVADAAAGAKADGDDDNVLDFDLDGDWSADEVSGDAFGDDELDLGVVSEVRAEGEAAEEPPVADELELSLEDFDAEPEVADAATSGDKAASAEADSGTDEDALGDFQLDDFRADEAAVVSADVGDDERAADAAAPAKPEAGVAGGDDDELSLDAFSLDDMDAASASADAGGDVAADETSVVSARLDLARAYVDMGEAELARPMLEEIVTQGDEAQQAEARRLMEQLG